jgi:hypothetical protein
MTAPEKSKGQTAATVPVHRDFAVSLAAARNAGTLGTREVFTGKLVKGNIMPMAKKAWAAKFKKFARLAGVNEPKKNCHGVRKARAEVAAYSECTEAQMMAMFGWRVHKMPALYIAKANRDKLAISGMEKIEAYDQMENIADLAMPTDLNRIVTFESNRRKKILRFQRQTWGWCARRAVAFAEISNGYIDQLRNKVHFGPKSTFRVKPH